MRSSRSSVYARASADRVRDLGSLTELSVNAVGVTYQLESVIEPTLLADVKCQALERERLDAQVARRTCSSECVLRESAAFLQVSQRLVHPGEAGCRQQRVVLIAKFAEHVEALPESRARRRPISPVGVEIAEHEDRVGDPPGITELAVQRKRLVPPACRLLEVPELGRHRRCSTQRESASGRGAVVGGESALESAQPLGPVAACVPEPPERSCQAQDELRFADVLQSIVGGAEIVML